jgi:hypothetical protein
MTKVQRKTDVDNDVNSDIGKTSITLASDTAAHNATDALLRQPITRWCKWLGQLVTWHCKWLRWPVTWHCKWSQWLVTQRCNDCRRKRCNDGGRNVPTCNVTVRGSSQHYSSQRCNLQHRNPRHYDTMLQQWKRYKQIFIYLFIY